LLAEQLAHVKKAMETSRAALAAAEPAAVESLRFVSKGGGDEWYSESSVLLQKIKEVSCLYSLCSG